MKTRVRQLPNGKWIGEVKGCILCRWLAADAVTRGYAWSAGGEFFYHCQTKTREEAEVALKNYISGQYGI